MKILAFGEILWDIFGGEKKIGGAPLNFISHCALLGAETDIVSAVGKDALGKEALEAVKAFGVGTDYVEVIKKMPTGYCEVTLDADGVPSYDLVTDVAYDNIPCPKKIKDTYVRTTAPRKYLNFALKTPIYLSSAARRWIFSARAPLSPPPNICSTCTPTSTRW